jgi:hypothetical protein
MQLHMTDVEVSTELETGKRQQFFHLDGKDVTFKADGAFVTVGRFILGLHEDAEGNTEAVTLDLLDVDGEVLDRLDEALELPAAAMSAKGAEVVKLRLQADILQNYVVPAKQAIGEIGDLFGLADEAGDFIFFDLDNYDLLEVAPG